jgi:hypothetical protein
LRAILSRLALSEGLVVSGPDVQDHLAVASSEADDARPSVGPGGGILTRLGRQKLEQAIQKLEQAIQQFVTGPLDLRYALSAALDALDHDAPLSPEHRRVLEDHRGGWFLLGGEVSDLLSTLSDGEMRRTAFCFRGRALSVSLGGAVLHTEAISLGEVREFLDGPSVTRPLAERVRSIDLAIRVATGERSELPLWARDELVVLATLVDQGALAVPGRADHRVAWASALRALVSAVDRRGVHFTSPMIDEATRGILITIEEWCWRRYRLTRPWPDPPGGRDLGGAFLDARRLLDGTGAYSYPHVSRDQLLSLLVEETSPLVAEERSAVRRLIDAADVAVAGAAAARRSVAADASALDAE